MPSDLCGYVLNLHEHDHSYVWLEAHVYFFLQKGFYFFTHPDFWTFRRSCLTILCGHYFFCHGHMSIQARRKFKKKLGWGGAVKGLWRKKILLLSEPKVGGVKGGGSNSPLDQVPPLPTALVSSEFNWNSTFICDRRRLVRTFEGQFSRLKSNNLRLWSFMLFYLITELCYFSKSGGANCNRMFIPSLFECFIWSNGILLFNFWIWASYLL